MSRVLILQHIDCEPAGLIEEALHKKGIKTEVIHCTKNPSLPQNALSIEGLVVMGGPMSAYEEEKYPHLRDEICLIRDAVEKNKPVLGVCLGSQLLAKAFGAEVVKGSRKEIGFFPIDLSEDAVSDPLFQGLPETFPALHWHGDIFSLPKGATLLASSDLTAHQAFRYGDLAYGLLFHLEINREILKQWIKDFENELREANIETAPILRGIEEYAKDIHQIGMKIFERWALLLGSVHSPSKVIPSSK